MGETTGISWCDHTHNEWIGCLKISAACASCYAEVSTPTRVLRAKGLEVWGPASTTPRHRTSEANRRKPFAWDRAAKRDGVRRRVFCSSLSDVFEDHPMLAPWRADLWRTIEACDGLDWQLLTKRPENILAMVPEAWRKAWPAHVWIGTTVEDQRRAEERIPHLLAVPAAVRFLSCEPLLEAVDLDPPTCPTCGGHDAEVGEDGAVFCCEHCDEMAFNVWLDPCASATQPGINWVIVGGESGPGARPFDLAWARSIVRQCREAGVPCFVKQLGDNPILSPGPITYPSQARAGADPAEWPADLRVQEFPEVSRG